MTSHYGTSLFKIPIGILIKLNRVLSDLINNIFIQADKQMTTKGKGKPGEALEKAAEVMMGCFRVCASDRFVI